MYRSNMPSAIGAGFIDWSAVESALRRCKDTLEKSPAGRSPVEVEQVRIFVEKCRLMRSMSYLMSEELARCMTIRYIAAGSIVYTPEDTFEEAYIVLLGRVALEDVNNDNHILALVEQGESFGEGRLHRKPSRFEQARCSLNTALIVVDRESFQNALMAHMEQENAVRKKTMQRVVSLNTMSDNGLGRLAAAATPVQFNRGHLIVAQGDPVEYVYIITSGSCSTFKQNPNSLPETSSSLSQAQNSARAHAVLRTSVKTGTVNCDEMVLHGDVVLQRPASVSLVCDADVEALQIPKASFLHLMNTSTADAIKDVTLLRDQWQRQRLSHPPVLASTAGALQQVLGQHAATAPVVGADAQAAAQAELGGPGRARAIRGFRITAELLAKRGPAQLLPTAPPDKFDWLHSRISGHVPDNPDTKQDSHGRRLAHSKSSRATRAHKHHHPQSAAPRRAAEAHVNHPNMTPHAAPTAGTGPNMTQLVYASSLASLDASPAYHPIDDPKASSAKNASRPAHVPPLHLPHDVPAPRPDSAAPSAVGGTSSGANTAAAATGANVEVSGPSPLKGVWGVGIPNVTSSVSIQSPRGRTASLSTSLTYMSLNGQARTVLARDAAPVSATGTSGLADAQRGGPDVHVPRRPHTAELGLRLLHIGTGPSQPSVSYGPNPPVAQRKAAGAALSSNPYLAPAMPRVSRRKWAAGYAFQIHAWAS